MLTLRYFADGTLSNTCPCELYSVFVGFLLLVTVSFVHLIGS